MLLVLEGKGAIGMEDGADLVAVAGATGATVVTPSVFFSAAAFSRIFATLLGLFSPKVELDAIFFNVEDAVAYFE